MRPAHFVTNGRTNEQQSTEFMTLSETERERERERELLLYGASIAMVISVRMQ